LFGKEIYKSSKTIKNNFFLLIKNSRFIKEIIPSSVIRGEPKQIKRHS